MLPMQKHSPEPKVVSHKLFKIVFHDDTALCDGLAFNSRPEIGATEVKLFNYYPDWQLPRHSPAAKIFSHKLFKVAFHNDTTLRWFSAQIPLKICAAEALRSLDFTIAKL